MPEQQQFLKKCIETEVFVRAADGEILGGDGLPTPWLFDFKRVILRSDFLAAFVNEFFARYEDRYPFQVGGLETGAIPLLVAISIEGARRGTPVNSFFIRKSRKKSGVTDKIVGVVGTEPIILVDDLLHSGKTFMEQINLLQQLRQSNPEKGMVTDVFSILRFRSISEYYFFTEAGIRSESVLELSDFSESLGIQNLSVANQLRKPVVYPALWHWRGETALFTPVLPKSDVLYHEGKVYFGTDDGYLLCFSATTGKVLWQYYAPLGRRDRVAFSSPVLCGSSIVVGSRDGNVYALHKETGKRLWYITDADWLQGTPGTAEPLGLVFLPLSFGLFRKQGKVVAVEAASGKQRWECDVEAPLGGGISYSKDTKQVYFGTEDGSFFALEAKTGTIVWKVVLKIKPRGYPSICPTTGLVVVSGVPRSEQVDDRGTVYGLVQKSGLIQVEYQDFFFGSYSTPCVKGGLAYFTALDKFLYCIDLRTGNCVWKYDLGARSFASPVLLRSQDGHTTYLCVGANNGHLYTFAVESGQRLGVTTLSERILNNVACAETTGTIYVPTQGNELYALKLTGLPTETDH